jgi:acyl CoA:acetate/3-ketoacid CoA transferase alpha subunit
LPVEGFSDMQIMTAAEAAALVADGDTVLIGGSGNGH